MRRFLPSWFCVVLFFGCAGLAVKRDYDTSVDFQQMKSYAWRSVGREMDSSLITQRVRDSVDKVLSEKGYKISAVAEADFLVASRYSIEEQRAPERVSTGIGVGAGSGGVFGGVSLGVGLGGKEKIVEETLVIEILDPVTGRILWQGSAHPHLNDLSPEKAPEKVNSVVEKLLSKFPPQ